MSTPQAQSGTSGQAQPSQQDKMKIMLGKLVNLMMELIGVCYDRKLTEISPELVEWVRDNYVENYDLNNMMNNFIKYTRLHWDRILVKDEQYFITDAIKIFGDIPSDQVNITKILFESKDKDGKSIISQKDKDTIWEMVTVMVKISIVHIHKCREPIREPNGEIKYTRICYSKGEHQVENLSHFARKFKVDLSQYVPH